MSSPFTTAPRGRPRTGLATKIGMTVVALLAIGWAGRWRYDLLLQQATVRKLSELDLRASQASEMLDRWLDDRFLVASEAVSELPRASFDSSAALPLDALGAYLQRHEFVGAWVIDAAGAVRSASSAKEILPEHQRRAAGEAAQRRTQALDGPVMLPSGAARMYFATPGVASSTTLLLAMDPGLSLYGDITVMGSSPGSTQRLRLLRRVGERVRIASPARGPSSEPLGLEEPLARVPSTWRDAVNGGASVRVVTGLGGTRTLSAGRALREAGLGLVLEMDAAEAFALARQRFRSELALTLAALLCGLTISLAAWRDGRKRRTAAAEVAREARRSEAILEAAGNGIVGVGPERRIEFANSAAHDLLAATPGSLVGRDIRELLDDGYGNEGWTRELSVYLSSAATARRGRRDDVVTLRRSDGSSFPAEFVATPRHEGGADVGTVFAFRDITDRLRIETARWTSEMRLRAIFDHAALGIAVLDAEGKIVDANRLLSHTLQIPADEMLHRHASTLVAPDDAGVVSEALRRVRDGVRTSAALVLRVAHGEDAHIDCRVSVSLLDPEDSRGGFVALIEDVTERKALERQLRHQAFHDPLTGLANRALFFEQMTSALARDARNEGSIAALFIDLDDFKLVNDQLGHHAGDAILRAVAERLRTATRGGDTIARLAGDEFAVMLHGLDSPQQMTQLAERILTALSRPFEHEGSLMSLTASVGVAQSTSSDDVGLLLRRADMAMYAAKRRGKGAFEVYDPSAHGATMDQLQLENELRRVIDRGELFLQYQPIVDMASQRIVSVEALVRWRHPSRGLVPTARFIALAESNGEIVPIGRWVLREACRQLAQWDAQGIGDGLTVSVNLSIRQLHDASLVHDVDRALDEFHLAPSRLQLEVTESALVVDSDAVTQRLHALAERGVSLAIDDFGTGYSSLAYLQRFPVHVLKIDKAFIDGVAHGGTSTALARTIIALGDMLGLRTIAEGVEHDRQRLGLLGLGCTSGQGYLFAHPLDAPALEAMLAEWHDAEAHAL